MDCKECKDYISAYVDGELEQRLIEDFKRHLNHCEDCKTLVQADKRVKTLLVEYPPLNPPKGGKQYSPPPLGGVRGGYLT